MPLCGEIISPQNPRRRNCLCIFSFVWFMLLCVSPGPTYTAMYAESSVKNRPNQIKPIPASNTPLSRFSQAYLFVWPLNFENTFYPQFPSFFRKRYPYHHSCFTHRRQCRRVFFCIGDIEFVGRQLANVNSVAAFNTILVNSSVRNNYDNTGIVKN